LSHADSSWDTAKKVSELFGRHTAVACGDDLDPIQDPACCDGRRLELASGIPNEKFLTGITMSAALAMELLRNTLEPALLLRAPILLVALLMGLLVSVLQIMISVQNMTILTVPRLLAVALTTFLFVLLSARELMFFMLGVVSDFFRYFG
jgi:flagellar biosynthetic protein FliQ